ncbi:hypothetical protein P4O66_006076 [Electrophorus voltai]|uniref:B box-type domain-containing protein n=1 Tax=Electrophorus voltai TaxID=2609070 RepID=A0AAD9DJ96_9TELE|nr:hypothetical protein P4O66_006076 [Electrophorus voltai]
MKSSNPEEQLPSKSKNVLCGYCNEERSCLDCVMSCCNTHLMPHKTTAKLKNHKLIDPVLFETYHKTHNTVPVERESHVKKARDIQRNVFNIAHILHNDTCVVLL